MSDEQVDARASWDDRPPICPACGVTMGLIVAGDEVRHECLECGFVDDGVWRATDEA